MQKNADYCNTLSISHSRILSAAEITKSDALHPGYGFLAERADFASSSPAKDDSLRGKEVVTDARAHGNRQINWCRVFQCTPHAPREVVVDWPHAERL